MRIHVVTRGTVATILFACLSVGWNMALSQDAPQTKPVAGTTSAETSRLTNQDIISLAKSGLNDSIIISLIQKSKTQFDVSPNTLITLNKAGLSDAVIKAMIAGRSSETPESNVGSDVSVVGGVSRIPSGQEPDYLGVYFLLVPDTGNLLPLERQTEQARTSMRIFGGQGFYQFNGEKSHIRFKRGQKLEFVVRVSSQEIDPISIVQFFSLQSIDGTRRLVAADAGFLGIGAQSDLMKRQAITFNTGKYGKSSFRITPAHDLPPGEYGLSVPGKSDSFLFGIDPTETRPVMQEKQ